MFKLSKRQKRRLITGIILVFFFILIVERIYNSRDEFNIKAKDKSNYKIVEAKLSTAEKLYDFKHLYDILEKNYPFFEVNKKLNGIDWLGNKNKYIRMIKNTKYDVEYFAAMEKILGDLNNPHVRILDGKEYECFYKFYYNTHKKSNTLSKMARYEVFNNFRVMYRYEFLNDIKDFELYKEPVLKTKLLIEDELAYIKIKEMAGFERAKEDFEDIKDFLKKVEDFDKLIIDIRGNNKGKDEYWKNIVSLLIDEPLTVEYYSFFKDGHRYNRDPYKVENVKTIKLLNEKTLDEFPPEAISEYSYYKNNLIEIEPWENERDPIDFQGKIYLLVDKKVFASSEKFASFSKDTGFATLVGETTGGNKIFEKFPIISLPKTRFAVSYSRELGMNLDGSINMETRTKPHIEVDPTYHEDFRKDKSIQAVIKD